MPQYLLYTSFVDDQNGGKGAYVRIYDNLDILLEFIVDEKMKTYEYGDIEEKFDYEKFKQIIKDEIEIFDKFNFDLEQIFYTQYQIEKGDENIEDFDTHRKKLLGINYEPINNMENHMLFSIYKIKENNTRDRNGAIFSTWKLFCV